MPETKQVIVIRKDLNMRKGKMCAQAAHASMMAFLRSPFYKQVPTGMVDSEIPNATTHEVTFRATAATVEWLSNETFAKITVSVNSEAELREIFAKARAANLPSSFVIDHGRTEFHGVLTPTAVAIGPAWDHEIDPITKHLPLL